MLWKGPLLFSAVAVLLAFLYPISSEVHRRILASLPASSHGRGADTGGLQTFSLCEDESALALTSVRARRRAIG